MNKLLTKDKLIDQGMGLAFGIVAGVGLAVGLEVYNAIDAAPDAALLDLGFWKNVGYAALATGIRSLGSAVGTFLGWNIRGVSSA